MIANAMESFGKGFVDLRRLEAAKEIAALLSKSPNISYLPNSGNLGYLLDINSKNL